MTQYIVSGHYTKYDQTKISKLFNIHYFLNKVKGNVISEA